MRDRYIDSSRSRRGRHFPRTRSRRPPLALLDPTPMSAAAFLALGKLAAQQLPAMLDTIAIETNDKSLLVAADKIRCMIADGVPRGTPERAREPEHDGRRDEERTAPREQAKRSRKRDRKRASESVEKCAVCGNREGDFRRRKKVSCKDCDAVAHVHCAVVEKKGKVWRCEACASAPGPASEGGDDEPPSEAEADDLASEPPADGRASEEED